jgi:membrane protein DedA with SNARE-associated domain
VPLTDQASGHEAAAPGEAAVVPALAAETSELTGLVGALADVVVALGPAGVFLLVVLETVVPPVPSEVVLPLAGFLAGQGRMSFVVVLLAATAGSMTGALLLYALGARLGRDRLARLLERLPLTGVRDLEKAEGWFDRHGAKAVLIGRVIPGARSLISIPAGVQRMPMSTFVPLTLLGSACWNLLLVGAGHQLGRRWQTVGDYSDVLSWAVVGALALAVTVVLGRRWARQRAMA